MLQQTRAEVVIPYFERWMERFPTIEVLAEASIEEVIKEWEGLGYYSRARNLHAGAKQVVEEYGGKLPMDDLQKIKGIGPYTSGAILSFAFHKKAAAVDGNVKRVVSRLYASDEEIEKRVLELLPDREPWVMMEALIELGALVCKPRPDCSRCPLNEGCQSHLGGRELEFPRKVGRQKVTHLEREVAVILFGREVLVRKNEGSGVMADLFEFPYFAKGESSMEGLYPNELERVSAMKRQEHTFTRYRVRLFPKLWKASEKAEVSGFTWVRIENLQELPFSSGHRKILKNLLEETS